MRTFVRPSTDQEWMDLWWVRLPAWLRRFSDPLAALAADGSYLCAWPRVGIYAPGAAFVFGLLLGQHYLFHSEVFSSSSTVLILLVMIGVLSSALGLWLSAGYMLADLCMPHSAIYAYRWEKIIYPITVRLSLPIAHLLLILLVAVIPFVSRYPFEKISLSNSAKERWPAALILQVQTLLQFVLVYLWLQSYPVLIRPIFFWNQGGSPQTPDISTIQDYGWMMLVAGTIMIWVRFALTRQAAGHPEVLQRQSALADLPPLAPARRRAWPLAARVFLKAGVTTYFVSGMITKWREAAALPCVLAVLYWLHEKGFLSKGGGWSSGLSRVPVLVRVTFGAILVYLITYEMIARWAPQAQSFWPIILGVVVGQIVFMLLNPKRTT